MMLLASPLSSEGTKRANEMSVGLLTGPGLVGGRMRKLPLRDRPCWGFRLLLFPVLLVGLRVL